MGWFTDMAPVAFELSATAAAVSDPPRPATWLGVSRRRRAGRRGLGALRCLPRDAALRQRAEAVPDPAMAFNYLGELRGRGAASVSVRLPGSSTRTKAALVVWTSGLAVIRGVRWASSAEARSYNVASGHWRRKSAAWR